MKISHPNITAAKEGRPWIKVWLDDDYDLRKPPEPGYIWVTTVDQVIALLLTGQVQELDLDNDLGENELEGRQVLNWLEVHVNDNPEFVIPEIYIHSANIVAGQYMVAPLEKLRKLRKEQQSSK